MSLEQDFSTTKPTDDQDALTPNPLVALSTAPDPIDAESMSSTLLPLLQATDLPLTCLSRHDHACNFQTADGAIIALVTPQHGNGPFHVVLPHRLPALLTGGNAIRAQWQQGTIVMGSCQITLQRAVAWQPQLPAFRNISFNALFSLHEVNKRYPASPLNNGAPALRARAQQGIAALQNGFMRGEQEKICVGVLCLAGLGPGLTPAGDDFLVGLLAALCACRLHVGEEQMKFSQLIAQTATAQTTRLSGQWLCCAGQGHFGEAWHNLITALSSDDSVAVTTAAHRILTTGATSGVDAMSGFLFGINLFKDKKTGRQEDRKTRRLEDKKIRRAEETETPNTPIVACC